MAVKITAIIINKYGVSIDKIICKNNTKFPLINSLNGVTKVLIGRNNPLFLAQLYLFKPQNNIK